MKILEEHADPKALRREAEALLTKRSSTQGRSPSEADLLMLNHELEVHQIELEMQNTELARARTAIETIADKYVALYDFAPVGYFLLSKNGEILELNILGAQYLGKERSLALRTRVALYLHDDFKIGFNEFLERVFVNGTEEHYEVLLTVDGTAQRYVVLTGIVLTNRNECFLAMHDVTENRLIQQEREHLVLQLQDALAHIKTMSGLIPICATCKKIRDDKGFWNHVEHYVMQHSDARFSHGICPECLERDFPHHRH